MDENQLEMADAFARSEIERGIARSRIIKPIPVDFDGDCSCGEQIPQARIDAGYYNCVECQEALERGAHI